MFVLVPHESPVERIHLSDYELNIGKIKMQLSSYKYSVNVHVDAYVIYLNGVLKEKQFYFFKKIKNGLT